MVLGITNDFPVLHTGNHKCHEWTSMLLVNSEVNFQVNDPCFSNKEHYITTLPKIFVTFVPFELLFVIKSLRTTPNAIRYCVFCQSRAPERKAFPGMDFLPAGWSSSKTIRSCAVPMAGSISTTRC